MLNNKKYITLIQVFLVLYIIAGGIFIFKIINDRIAYLSRNNTIDEAYIDLPSDNIKESFILKNKKNKLDGILISENLDTLQLDNVVDKKHTMLLSSSLGYNEKTQIQLKIEDELNYSKDANVLIDYNKQSQREISLCKRINKIKSTIYISDFDKELNDMLLGSSMVLKMYKEFSTIDFLDLLNNCQN